MTQQKLTKPLNGLKEDIVVDIAKHRIIKTPKALNTTLEKLYEYLNESDEIHSYMGFSAATRIGFAELHGRREAQEDRIVFGLVPNFSKLSEAKRQSVLTQTIAKLTQMISHYGMNRTGATLCLTVIDQHRIYAVNVGDSTAYLAILDKNGCSTQFKRLNKHLHHPTDPIETKRLEEAGKEGFIQYERLMGLALSRAIGDTALEPFGLIHLPDIYIDTANIPPNGKAFVIVACDGLTEGHCLAETAQADHVSIEALIQENAQRTPEEIAAILSHQAIEMESGDNVSVLVTEIDHTVIPKYMGIFDGHGGVACAELLRQHFHDVFVNEINDALE